MKRLLAFFPLLLTAKLPAAAQDYGQALTVKIWDNAAAPHSNGISTPETLPAPNRIGNVSAAELYIFPADPAEATGQAVVICPGGGYERLAMDYEGYDVAEWLAANGITAAVLKYRMPAGHPEVPLEDAEQAIRIMKGLAPGAGKYAAERVGIAGFSAGGHLAAMTSNLAETEPDFAVLFYPVITARKGLAHEGSFDNLLGPGRDAESEARYSLENRVTEQTPPTLLLLSDDDGAVPPANSTLYYNALKQHGIEASLHVYPVGGHGWGIRENFRYRAQWQAAVLDWLERLRTKNEN
ncbi:MAG: alpha/beta hydrolase [Alistipes sp.]|nr:alpha/beta hydrolase [Alistipes sp.]